MFTFLQARRRGRQLARSMRRHLLQQSPFWAVKQGAAVGYNYLEFGQVRIVTGPNERCPCLALLDHTRLYVDGVAVHVPLVARLRLRAAARLVAAEHAARIWSER